MFATMRLVTHPSPHVMTESVTALPHSDSRGAVQCLHVYTTPPELTLFLEIRKF